MELSRTELCNVISLHYLGKESRLECICSALILCYRFFDIPKSVLPEIRSSSEIYGVMTSGPLQGVSISGVSMPFPLIIMIINAVITRPIPVWYMCEAQSAISETIQQYTTQFDNALHSSLCLSLLPTYTHTSTCHTDTHACAHFHYPSLQSLSQSLPPPTTTILEQSPIKMSAKEILKKWVQPPMSVRGLT